MAIHSIRKKLTGMAFAAALLAASMPMPVQASLSMPSARAILFAFGAVNWTILYNRKPAPKFKKNYDLNKFVQLNNIGTKQYWDNLRYAWHNGFVGQIARGRHVKVDDDGNVKSGSKTCEAYGVLGTIDSYIKPYQKAAKSMIYMCALYQLLNKDTATSFDFLKASKG